jgi:UDP-N-acetylglucosamine:LPS N-acetylglucosamine transferase
MDSRLAEDLPRLRAQRTLRLPAHERAVAERTARRPAVLTVIPGAGFTFQTSCLVRRLAADLEIVFLKTPFGGEPGLDGLPRGEAYRVASFPVFTRPSRLRALTAAWATFWVTLGVILKRPIDLVVVVATPHAVPVLLAARILGRPTIFVESIARVDQLSLTGRLVRQLRLASRLFVQWPGLQAREHGVALGTVL